METNYKDIQYKVGDYVKIREDLVSGCSYDNWDGYDEVVVDEMVAYAGQIHQIVGINEDSEFILTCCPDCGWTSDMLIPHRILGVLGKPAYTEGAKLQFEVTWGYKKKYNVIGDVFVVDRYGTFEQNEEPSYDIMSVDPDGSEILYKHIRESSCTSVHPEAPNSCKLIENDKPENSKSEIVGGSINQLIQLVSGEYSDHLIEFVIKNHKNQIDELLEGVWVEQSILSNATHSIDEVIKALLNIKNDHPDAIISPGCYGEEVLLYCEYKTKLSIDDTIPKFKSLLNRYSLSSEYIQYLESKIK